MSLFGQPAASQSAFGSAPSLFGAPAQSSSSLFGSTQTTANLFGAPAQSTAGTFGAPAQSASLFGAPAQSSASLFGAQPQSSSSLFGAPAQSSASLFGAPVQSSGSLFGAPAPGGSLFGAPAQSAGSLFGAHPQQQLQQPQQGNAQPPAEITGRTRISHLPQNLQTDLFAVERHLRDQRTKGSKLWSKRTNYENELGQVYSRCSNVTRRLLKLRGGLESLKANSDTLKTAVRAERGSAEPVIIAFENISKANRSTQVGFLDNGSGLRYSGSDSRMPDRTTHVPEEYFARVIDELETRAHEYKAEIDEIAEYLRAQGVVLSSIAGSAAKSNGRGRAPRMTQLNLLDNISQLQSEMGIAGAEASVASKGKIIEEIIRRQYDYFMVVASHIAGVSENLRITRQHFLRLIRSREPDALNPFEQADFREKAEKDRHRIMADKRASEGAVALGNGSAVMASPQGSLYQSQPGTAFGNTSGAFATAATVFGQSSSSFAGTPGNVFGGTMNGSNGSQGRKGSGGRRKRA